MIYSLLIGLGGMGIVHLKNTEDLDSVRYVAAIGNSKADENRAKEFGLSYYKSISEALKDYKEITVADITTPTFLHASYVKEALSYGLDVIVEKPLSLSSEEAKELYALSEKMERNIYAAHVLRYTKEYKFALDAVKSGRYGKVLDATFSRLSATPSWDKDSWLSDEKKSGLVPFDLHIHDLDIIISAFGIPSDVIVDVNKDFGLYYKIRYCFDRFKVDAEAAWIDAPMPFSATYRIIFEEAVAIYDGTSLRVYKNGGTEDIDIKYAKMISTGINVPPTGWYYEEMKEIYSLIEKNEQSNVKKEEVLKELEIIEGFKGKKV